MVIILIYVTIVTNIQSPLNTRLHIKFEENGLGALEEKSFKDVNDRTDGRTDGRRTERVHRRKGLLLNCWLRGCKRWLCCRNSLEAPMQGASNEYPYHLLKS